MRKISFHEHDSKLINGLVQFGFMVGLFGFISCIAMSSFFFVGDTPAGLEVSLPLAAGCFLLFAGAIAIGFMSGLMSIQSSDQV